MIKSNKRGIIDCDEVPKTTYNLYVLLIPRLDINFIHIFQIHQISFWPSKWLAVEHCIVMFSAKSPQYLVLLLFTILVPVGFVLRPPPYSYFRKIFVAVLRFSITKYAKIRASDMGREGQCAYKFRMHPSSY